MKMLDLCCRGGLASAGYWLSGCFTEIVGIDLEDMKGVYPFDFIQGDAFALDYEFLYQFDFIHASPPCQFYSTATPEWARNRHPRLIPSTHLLLKAWGGAHVIENVGGSTQDLRPTLRLSGFDVGLPMQRYRYFHVCEENTRVSDENFTRRLSENIHRCSDEIVPGNSSEDFRSDSYMSIDGYSHPMISPHDSNTTRDELIEAFGLREISHHHLRQLTCEDIKQGIPPRMTRLIAQRMFPKAMIGVA